MGPDSVGASGGPRKRFRGAGLGSDLLHAAADRCGHCTQLSPTLPLAFHYFCIHHFCIVTCTSTILFAPNIVYYFLEQILFPEGIQFLFFLEKRESTV